MNKKSFYFTYPWNFLIVYEIYCGLNLAAKLAVDKLLFFTSIKLASLTLDSSASIAFMS